MPLWLVGQAGTRACLRQACRALKAGEAVPPIRFSAGAIEPLDCIDMGPVWGMIRDGRFSTCPHRVICVIHIANHARLGATVEQDVVERPDQEITVATLQKDLDT